MNEWRLIKVYYDYCPFFLWLAPLKHYKEYFISLISNVYLIREPAHWSEADLFHHVSDCFSSCERRVDSHEEKPFGSHSSSRVHIDASGGSDRWGIPGNNCCLQMFVYSWLMRTIGLSLICAPSSPLACDWSQSPLSLTPFEAGPKLLRCASCCVWKTGSRSRFAADRPLSLHGT